MSTEPTKGSEPLAEHEPQSSTEVSTEVRSAQVILSDMLGSSAIPALHNFQGTGLEQWQQTAVARSANCGGIADCVGRTISLANFYVHPVTLPGPTPGEIINTVRCVLFDKDGAPFAFVSEGIAMSLASIIEHCGMGPWNPPILVKVEPSKTNRGRTVYNIVPA